MNHVFAQARLLGVCGAVVIAARPVVAQRDTSRTDTVLAAAATGVRNATWVRVTRSAALVLKKPIAVDLRAAKLADALRALEAQADIPIEFGPDVFQSSARVSLHVAAMSLLDALAMALDGSGLEAYVSIRGDAILIRRPAQHAMLPIRQQGSGTVTGHVTDAKTAAPLTDVSVTMAGSGVGARTGNNGQYTVHAVSAGSHQLTFRRLGYSVAMRTVDVPADSTVQVDVALAPAATMLDQAVTTVTGRQQLRSMGNAISTINVDSLVPTTPVTNFGDVLNARAAGVQVINVGGLTGASPEIYIRGNGSLLFSTQPLLYIDGIRVSNTSMTSAPGNGQIPGRLNDLTPDEIESIEIVKGPSAATLYGTDAANGVILVTTKHGVSGRAQWRGYAEGGALTASPSFFPYNYTGWGTAGGQTVTDCTLVLQASGGCKQDSITKFTPMRVPGLTPLGTGDRTNVGLNVSGGAGGTRYFVAGDYASEVGYLKMPIVDQQILDTILGPTAHGGQYTHPNAGLKYDGRINLTAPIGHTGEVTLSTSYVSDDTRIPFNEPGGLAIGGAGYRDADDGWVFGIHPLYYFAGTSDDQTGHFTGAVTGRWAPISWLTTRATTGIDYAGDNYNSLTPSNPSLAALFLSSGVVDSKTTQTRYSLDLGATAKASLGAHLSSSTSAGLQYNRTNDLSSLASATDLTIGGTSVSSGIPKGTASDSESVVVGAYGEEQIGFNDRLFLTGAVRVDGANDFGTKFQSAAYPRVSGSWVASQEPFFPHIGLLNSFRLRAAYGESGTQPGLVLTTLTVQPYDVDGAQLPGAGQTTIGNPNIQPERQTELEGGTDIDLAAHRVHLEFTYYNKRTTNALYVEQLAPSLGGGDVESNIGEVWNWGYEALLSVTPVQTRSTNWTVDLNGSINHNQVLHLGPTFLPSYGQFGSPSLVAGYPINSYFAAPYSYTDANHDGVIEPNELTMGSGKSYYGPTLPPEQLTLGTHLGLLSGRVSFGAQFDYRRGFRLSNSSLQTQCGEGAARAAVDIHASLADQAACIAATGAENYDAAGTFQDGEFLKFRELSATYVAPPSLARRIGMQSWSVTLAARNLAVWSHYTNGDPEMAVTSFSASAYSSEGLYDGKGTPAAQYWLARFNMGW